MPNQGVSPIILPPTFEGMGAGAPIIEVKTASFTVTKADSGKKFLIVGATATVTITCPAITDGPFAFEVYVGSDVTVEIQSATADTITTFNDLAADKVGFATSSEKIGGSFEVLCDGTTLFVLARICSSYQNVTITS